MIVAEFGSTGAVVMLVFQASEDGNGTNPFRLPRLPVLMFPQDAPPPDAVALLMVRLTVEFAVCVVELESVTVTATELVPAAVGVPEMAPVELLIDNPAGSPLAE